MSVQDDGKKKITYGWWLFALIALVFVLIWAAYFCGKGRGYDGGYLVGKLDGYSEGYWNGQADTYDQYKEGYRDGYYKILGEPWE